MQKIYRVYNTCFSKDKLQSFVTPTCSRSTDFWVTIRWPLREIVMPEVSCFDLVKIIALNLSGLTIIELVVNQSIAKPDLLVSDFISTESVTK